MYTIRQYENGDKARWNDFVSTSPTGHFMFHRNYMEYHADRFDDHSLLLHEGKKLVAVIPASAANGVWTSHQGLTFGGLVVGAKVYAAQALALTTALTEHLAGAGFTKAVIKAMPAAFAETAREDLLYALHRNGWTVGRRDLSSVIDYAAGLPYRQTKRHAVRNAAANDLTMTEDAGPERLWPVLESVLMARHDTAPTHSAAEIALLASRFPKNIRFFSAEHQGRVLGGAVMFLQAGAAHTQYLAVNDEGRALGALDYTLDALIGRYRETHRWFSFGISTTEGGTNLNESLIFQKEGFGARGVVHDFYERSF